MVMFLFPPSIASGIALFQESFDDGALAKRGWYDSPRSTISSVEHISGSTGSFECRFLPGARDCSGGAPMRRSFAATSQVLISYWIKHSSSWVGSGTTYHPHMIYLLTNMNGAYSGPAYTFLTAYVEENQGYPQMNIQDGQNVDEMNIGVDLSKITESRAVAGCNGTQMGVGQSETGCYLSGSVHWNGMVWKGGTAFFTDATHKTGWHFVEAYFKLNSISDGIGQPDGVVRYWYDGQLEIEHVNVIVRTGKNPGMQFNQFILAPYIGNGSPVDQAFWIDNLSLNTAKLTDTTRPPSPPTNFRVP